MRFTCHWLKRMNPFKKRDTHLSLFAKRRKLAKQKPTMAPALYEKSYKNWIEGIMIYPNPKNSTTITRERTNKQPPKQGVDLDPNRGLQK